MVGIYREPVEVDLNQILWNELVIKSVVTSGVFTDWERTIAMVETGQIKLKPLVSDRFALEDWEELFKRRKKGLLLKGLFVL